MIGDPRYVAPLKSNKLKPMGYVRSTELLPDGNIIQRIPANSVSN